MINEFSKIVCVPELDILGSSKTKKVSYVRELYWLILLKNGFAVTEIARLCGRTHGAVSVGIKRINGLISTGEHEVTMLYELTKNIKKYA